MESSASPNFWRQLRGDVRSIFALYRFWSHFGSRRIETDLPKIWERMCRHDQLVPLQDIGPRRYDLINAAVERRNYGTYLEIGVRNPADCFERVKVARKWSVDPGMEYSPNPVDFPFTSDEFFAALDQGQLVGCPQTWDVIFIDGLHRAGQVWRDIENASRFLSPRGMIFLHDCLPPSEVFARETFEWRLETGLCWNGSVWKALARYIESGPWHVEVVSTDWGVGVIDSARLNRRNLSGSWNPFFEFDLFVSSIEKHGLVTDPKSFLEALTRQ